MFLLQTLSSEIGFHVKTSSNVPHAKSKRTRAVIPVTGTVSIYTERNSVGGEAA